MSITRQQALDCFASDDLIGIGMEASAVRARLHPDGIVTYMLERTLHLSDALGRALPERAIVAEVEEAISLGATGLTLDRATGHILDDVAALVRGIRARFPALSLTVLDAPELLAFSRVSHLSLESALERLQDAGADTIASGGASLLAEQAAHTEAATTCALADWLAVHRAAHKLGMRTTARLAFGGGESIIDRLAALDAIAALQQETGGFTAFLPYSFKPRNPAPGNRGEGEPTAVEYLKTVAISRMVLEAIPNVEATWDAQGLKVLEMALRFGANDAGPAQLSHQPRGATEEELRRIIRDAGYTPVQRDVAYRTMFFD